MSETDQGNRSVAAVIVLALEAFSNEELAALHNGVTGFGRVATVNLGYKKGVEHSLINADGSMRFPILKDEMEMALTHEVTRRMEAGTYN